MDFRAVAGAVEVLAMIDHVVITDTVKAVAGTSPSRLQGPWVRAVRRSALGGTEPIYKLDPLPGLRMVCCPTTGQLDLRLNPSRLTNRSGLNFPLVDFYRWDRRATAEVVLSALGCPESTLGERAVEWADRFLEYGVREVAFAWDVPCADLPEVLRAVATVKQRSTSQVWGSPPQTVQWDSSRRNLMFYDKAAELNRGRPRRMREHDEAKQDVRRAASQLADGMLRVEVTYRGALKVRTLLGLKGGELPTFGWVARSELGAYAITREIDGLGLRDPGAVDEADSFINLCRIIAARSAEIPGGRASTRRSAPATRILSAAGLLMLQGELSKAELFEHLRLTQSTYQEIRRFLRDIGLSDCGGPSPRRHRLVGAFVRSLFRQLGGRVESLDDCEYINAPWAADEDEVEQRVEDFMHLEDEYVAPDGFWVPG